MAKQGAFHNHLLGRFRRNRFKEIDRIIRRLLETREVVSILDAGGRAIYWKLLSSDIRLRVRITVLNYGSELIKYDDDIADLQISNVVGDACEMPEFDDGSFDLVHSNSVIEHVGNFRNMARFADEVRRVGIYYYVQTPFFWFPMDPHGLILFLHWLPDPVRIFLLTRFNIGYRNKRSNATFKIKTDYPQALKWIDDTKMIDRALMRHFFPDGRVINERFFLLTKSVTMVRSGDD
jgi:hypothetical protein